MYWIECGWRRTIWQNDSSWPNCPHHAPFSVDDTCIQIQKRTKLERPPSLLAPRGDGTTQIDVGHQRRRNHSPREWRGIVPPKPCRNRFAFIRVAIHCKDGVRHHLGGDGANEMVRWRSTRRCISSHRLDAVGQCGVLLQHVLEHESVLLRTQFDAIATSCCTAATVTPDTDHLPCVVLLLHSLDLGHQLGLTSNCRYTQASHVVLCQGQEHLAVDGLRTKPGLEWGQPFLGQPSAHPLNIPHQRCLFLKALSIGEPPQCSTETPTLAQRGNLEHGRHVRLCQCHKCKPGYLLRLEGRPGDEHIKQVQQLLNIGHSQPVESLGSDPRPKASGRCDCHRFLLAVRREHCVKVGQRCDGSVPDIDEPCTLFLGERHPSGVGRGNLSQGALGGNFAWTKTTVAIQLEPREHQVVLGPARIRVWPSHLDAVVGERQAVGVDIPARSRALGGGQGCIVDVNPKRHPLGSIVGPVHCPASEGVGTIHTNHVAEAVSIDGKRCGQLHHDERARCAGRVRILASRVVNEVRKGSMRHTACGDDDPP
eukprot:m.409948 g.409948  ORF g.409948 m.409948 type:complete len:538 (-) comp28460_c0_seq14:274-1887(-)